MFTGMTRIAGIALVLAATTAAPLPKKPVRGAAKGGPLKEPLIESAIEHFDNEGYDGIADIEGWISERAGESRDGGIDPRTAKSYAKLVDEAITKRRGA